jgi:hypothetical protein
MQHLLEAGVHFLFFDEFSAISLCDSFIYSGAEVGMLLDQAKRGFLYQTFSVRAGIGCDLDELGFLFRCEMHFHELRIAESSRTALRAGFFADFYIQAFDFLI